MQVVILAGGLATRLENLTKVDSLLNLFERYYCEKLKTSTCKVATQLGITK
ncbi:MAG: hypothetical protein HOC20_12525 [Chloroflexi bacterium]|jgi:hypothetical protein|nr:hypothetical protein [Chloroflexota bacterium]